MFKHLLSLLRLSRILAIIETLGRKLAAFSTFRVN